MTAARNPLEPAALPTTNPGAGSGSSYQRAKARHLGDQGGLQPKPGTQRGPRSRLQYSMAMAMAIHGYGVWIWLDGRLLALPVCAAMANMPIC